MSTEQVTYYLTFPMHHTSVDVSQRFGIRTMDVMVCFLDVYVFFYGPFGGR